MTRRRQHVLMDHLRFDNGFPKLFSHRVKSNAVATLLSFRIHSLMSRLYALPLQKFKTPYDKI